MALKDAGGTFCDFYYLHIKLRKINDQQFK